MGKYIDFTPSGRNTAIDTAKGIAILLVIIGHCYWLRDFGFLARFIYSFHMPLFFIISGFFLKDITFKQAIKKYGKAYLWPYLIIGMFIILIGITKDATHGRALYETLKINAIKILWGSNCESGILFGNIPHIGPSWFLLALFEGCVLYSIMRYIPKVQDRFFTTMLIVCLCICISKIMKLPLSISGGGICVIYLYLGNYIRKYQLLKIFEETKRYTKIVLIAFWVLFACRVSSVDIGSGSLGFSIVGTIVSIYASMFVLNWSCRINMWPWIGRNTLNILCAHILVWRILDIFDISSKDLPFNPLINLMIEVSYEIVLALLLAWCIEKTNLLHYDKLLIKS